MTTAPNLRCSQSCYECYHNQNRLNKKSEQILCDIHVVPKSYIASDWVCDDYDGNLKVTFIKDRK